ncbi:MAG: peptide chain release factor N(5)-glutamine methyltransferase [Deltaproteobacteria bacterium]|nr:peptide chain release factor N(5)-glutamine methyltransferase [Deltaproteobacteria bacterium]
MSPSWTILQLIRWTAARFQREGLPGPRLEAEILLAQALGKGRVDLYIHFDQPLQPEELARFKTLIQRRLRREPLAYIIGRKEFWSLEFEVTPDVLIPRPETETLVAQALEVLSSKEHPWRILEIGTGSGAVAVALAREFPSAAVSATDLSPAALRLAGENARRNQVHERIEFLAGNLFRPVGGRTFDLIVTNPPYIPRGQLSSLPPEIRDYEPRLALDGGEDGLDFFRRALPQAGRYLLRGSWFLAEIGCGQEEAVRQIAGRQPDLDSLSFAPDLSGIQRVFRARKK